MIEYIITSVSLLFLSSAMFGMSYFLWRKARNIFHVPAIVDLIFFFVFVKIGFYYLLPTFMRIGSDYRFVREDGVKLSDLVFLYYIEFISWSIWGIVMLCVLNLVATKKKKMGLGDFFLLNRLESKIILVVLALGFITTRIIALLDIESGLFLEIFKSLFFYAGLAAGPFLMVLALKYYGKIFFVIGVGSSLLALLSLSTRGALVYLILFSFYLAWFIVRDRKSKAIIVSMFCALVITYFTLGGLFSGSIYIDEAGSMRINTGIDVEKKGDRSALEEVEWRLGAPTRLGTSFINLYNRGEGAGFNPIKHSLMGFLPRSINLNKPHPSTLDGDDIYSQGMYVIYREIYGNDTFNMVEFPTGAHFYWEFGIIGVLMLSAVSGLYVALCAHYFSKLGFVAFPLVVAIFKPWGYVDPKIWVSDIAIQMYQIILPLILLVFIVRFICYGSKVFTKLVTRSAKTKGILGRGIDARSSP